MPPFTEHLTRATIFFAETRTPEARWRDDHRKAVGLSVHRCFTIQARPSSSKEQGGINALKLQIQPGLDQGPAALVAVTTKLPFPPTMGANDVKGAVVMADGRRREKWRPKHPDMMITELIGPSITLPHLPPSSPGHGCEKSECRENRQKWN